MCSKCCVFSSARYATVSKLGTDSETQISRTSCDLPEVRFWYFKFRMLKYKHWTPQQKQSFASICKVQHNFTIQQVRIIIKRFFFGFLHADKFSETVNQYYGLPFSVYTNNLCMVVCREQCRGGKQHRQVCRDQDTIYLIRSEHFVSICHKKRLHNQKQFSTRVKHYS